jgi:hypothetical protein
MCISSIPKTIGNAVGKVMPPVPSNPVTNAVVDKNPVLRNTATGRALKSARTKPEDQGPQLQ